MKSTISNIRLIAAGLVLMCAAAAQQAAPAAKGFATAQAAADALIAAASTYDVAALEELFGPAGKELIHTGDAVQDKNAVAAFAEKAKQKKTVTVDPKNKSRAVLTVGELDWPLPTPIVKRQGKWYFDAAAGKQETLYRRIGANELDAIQICRGFVEAQQEYATLAREVTGVAQYAQKLFSTPGKRDGLYWKPEAGIPVSPISEPVARAIEEGYSVDVRSAYHGYYFKVLKGQGPAARMGEMDFVIRGVMIGGFALIAAPAEYGVSGLKTFMVSHEGIVYEKDLGPDTLNIAKQIERFNPDKTWRRTEDTWPPDSGQ